MRGVWWRVARDLRTQLVVLLRVRGWREPLIALLEGVRGGWRWVYTCWPPSLRPTHTAAYTDRGKDTDVGCYGVAQRVSRLCRCSAMERQRQMRLSLSLFNATEDGDVVTIQRLVAEGAASTCRMLEKRDRCTTRHRWGMWQW